MTVLSAIPTETEAGTRLDRFLSERFDTLSRSRAKTLIKEGHCKMAGAAMDDPRHSVVAGREYALTIMVRA
ncbi:MAG: RluA family pseudouridine synthase, partial [Pseudomonadota bacterium]